MMEAIIICTGTDREVKVNWPLLLFLLEKIMKKVAPFIKTKYTMKRPDIKESSLEIKNLAEEDSGIYFCASSVAQYLNLAKHLNNNLKLSPDDQR